MAVALHARLRPDQLEPRLLGAGKVVVADQQMPDVARAEQPAGRDPHFARPEVEAGHAALVERVARDLHHGGLALGPGGQPVLFGLLGLGIGIVSRSFGIGGGFLLVPAMTTLGALPMYVAVPISLIGTSFSSIGAFIGYLTNRVAIRMLFRPLRAWHIGRLKIPMTPGVIPSKRHELAANIGEMVGEHLLTGDEISRALQKEGFQEHLQIV